MSAKKRQKTARSEPGVNGLVKPPLRPPDASARARARALRDERVDHVVDLMLSGKWQGTKTHRALAAKWECSVGVVCDYAREASGVVRRAVVGDGKGGEEIRSIILAGIEHVRRVAMALKKPMLVGKDEYAFVSTPDVKAALHAYELHAKILGAFAPEVIEVRDEFATMSDEEVERALEAKLKEMRQRKAVPDV